MKFYNINDKISNKQQLNALMSNLKLAVIVLNRDYEIVSINRRAVKILKIDISYKNKTLLDLVNDPEMKTAINRLYSLERDKSFFSLSLKDKLYSLHFSSYPIYNKIGRKDGMLILIKREFPEKKFSKLREDFVANVSHELKTPLTVIKGAVETLQNGGIDDRDEAEHFVNVIKKHSDRLSALINDILSLSSIEQKLKRKNVSFSQFSLKEMVDDVLVFFEEKFQENSIDVTVETQDDISLTGNKILLEQAVSNLVDNAIKYSDVGSKIIIRAEKINNKILISVKDYGIGIRQDDIQRLFERFYRVDKVKSRNLGGTGLGLSIVKQIVKVHKGNITVKSKPDSGSTFTLILPCKISHENELKL